MNQPFRLLALFVLISAAGCRPSPVPATGEQLSVGGTGYDANLAEHLGADEFGMRTYVMAFLKAGPNRDQDSATAAALQRGHMEAISRLAGEGKLVLAGPFLAGTELRGLFLFAVDSVEEARALTETDPAVQAGRLEMDLLPWYGSAALMTVNDTHQRVARRAP
jgi:uncharacterized protein